MESLELSLMEFLKEKETFETLGYELLGVKDGSIENKEKLFLVRRKINNFIYFKLKIKFILYRFFLPGPQYFFVQFYLLFFLESEYLQEKNQ